MQEFVAELVGQHFQNHIRIFAAGQCLPRFFQLLVAFVFGALAELHQSALTLHGFHFREEMFGLQGDQRLRFDSGLLPEGAAFFEHMVEVIHRIQVDIVKVCGFRCNIARHRQIDQQHRFVPALGDGGGDVFGLQYRHRTGGGADHDIRLGEMFGRIRQRQRICREAGGEGLRVLQCPVGDDHPFHVRLGQMLSRQFDGLAGADQHHAGLVQLAEQLPGQFYAGIGHGYRMRTDTGFGPDTFGGGESLLEQAVEQAMHAALLAGHRPGLLDLSEDLRLAHDERVESGGHPEQMPDRILVLVLVEVAAQRLGRDAMMFGQPARQRRFMFGGDVAVDFRPVAGAEQDGLFDTGDLHQRRQRLALLAVRHAHAFAQVDRRGLVIQAKDKQGHSGARTMTVYFSLCTLCCMRSIAFSLVFAVLPGLFPSTGRADVSALPAERLEALLQSEFLFQSGQFNQAFSYYRAQAAGQLSADELLRGSQLATVLGETAWLASLDGAPALADATQIDLIRQRFETALQAGRSASAQQAWQALLRNKDERGIPVSRAVAEAHAVRHQPTLNAALGLYAERPDLTAAERFELFQFAYQWRLDAMADRLQGGLPPQSAEAALAATIRECVEGAADACKRRLQRLDPLDLNEWQRRSVLVLAQRSGDTEQNRRWLEALPQDGGTYYQRIVLLGRAMDDAKARELMAQIRKDAALDDFQRPVLLGSLSELLKDWPEAETNYREALTAGVPTTASVRLAVALFRQGKREAAFAQLQAVEADARLSEEIRRDAFQTEIQFHRILRSDQQDVEVLNAVYRRGLALWPQANPLRYQYAMRLFGQNRLEPAMAELQTILKTAPADADALNAYGFTLAKELNKPRAAFKPIAQAFLLAPEQAEILDSYGYVLFRLGRDEEALIHLQKAWQLTPSAVTAGHLGQVFLRLGDRQQANDYLEKGLQLDASEAELLALRERLR